MATMSNSSSLRKYKETKKKIKDKRKMNVYEIAAIILVLGMILILLRRLVIASRQYKWNAIQNQLAEG